jgi:hypothetical protein
MLGKRDVAITGVYKNGRFETWVSRATIGRKTWTNRELLNTNGSGKVVTRIKISTIFKSNRMKGFGMTETISSKGKQPM